MLLVVITPERKRGRRGVYTRPSVLAPIYVTEERYANFKRKSFNQGNWQHWCDFLQVDMNTVPSSVHLAVLEHSQWRDAIVEQRSTWLPRSIQVPPKDAAPHCLGTSAVKHYPNVKLFHITMKRYFSSTPLEKWFQEGNIARTMWPVQHSSDVLRYLTLWKYGGTYMDLDIIVTSSCYIHLVKAASNFHLITNSGTCKLESFTFMELADMQLVYVELADIQLVYVELHTHVEGQEQGCVQNDFHNDELQHSELTTVFVRPALYRSTSFTFSGSGRRRHPG
uniref:Glycosyltransferase n=1 Tax=Timema cristinae TaxID=61476 RepID=A0A7R9H8P4_TIMCR|nr:unnamed protein product [Timema cristinae]